MFRGILLSIATALTVLSLVQLSSAVDPPKDRVVAMYFHRTERCPTCKKMGSYTEDVFKKRFAKELKAKSVEFHYVDFQDKRNAALTKAYRIKGPALVVARVQDNKVAEFKNLKEIWDNVSDKKAFCRYVEESVNKYRKRR